jgi:enolase
MAAGNISGPISESSAGTELDQSAFDRLMIHLDGTPNKSRLGANAILAASLAFARAAADEAHLSLHRYLAELIGVRATHLPRPTINLFSGGKHAGGQVPVQDVLLVTISATSIDEALSMTSDVYRAAADLVQRKYGERPLVADEGGLAPSFPTVTAMLDDAVEAIVASHLRPGTDMALCIDVASSHFSNAGQYHWGDAWISPDELIGIEMQWIDDYPVVSIEDGLGEDDWVGWTHLKGRVEGRARVVGDDLLATNPDRIARAIDLDAADTLLLKPNQIGTVSEALDACRLARSAGWMVIASARSGETEDSWLADLAVGWSVDQLKVGSITRSERLAKWNRLLIIERQTKLPIVRWPMP